MTSTEMKHFQSRLQQERAETIKLLKALDNRLTEDDELGETVYDQSDAATLLTDQEETSAEQAQLQATLTQIDDALERIAAGTYGISQVSGKPIPLERLEALPYATTLVDE
ncbi:hypothetical protein BH10CHL1_BH10CHL1_29730 [soil metagenome]